MAEAVYDATVVFCDRFVDKRSRTHDQMVQAARSGVRNISEGSGAAATSRKSEMMLTNVARASLKDELLRDYESFLRQRGLPIWAKDSRVTLEMRERLKHDFAPNRPPALEGAVRLTGLAGLVNFVAEAEPELAANAMLCAVHQASYLLHRLIERQGRDFVHQGGFTEQLYSARVNVRDEGSHEAPLCPLCGKEMRRRTAGKGPRAGQPFWGCSSYPNCRGALDIKPSDRSDLSDLSDHKGTENPRT